MNQQNVLKVDDLQQNADQNQNQAVVAGAVPPNDESLPPVFKLFVHYWDDVFDWLSVEDVHSFGRTCKALQKVTGEYFKSKYPSFSVLCESNSYRNKLRGIPDFMKFLPNYDVEDDDEDEFNEHVISTCKSLKHVSIFQKHLSTLFIKLLKPILPSLETLDIRECTIDVDIFENILKYCVNLKSLIIEQIEIPFQKYPVLQHLFLGIDTRLDLNTFFTLNPTIRYLTTELSNIWNMIDSNITLDDLTIEVLKHVDENVFIILNDLHNRGFYKRLHISVEREKWKPQFATLPGLNTLYVDDVVVLPTISSLKELGIYDLSAFCDRGLNINIPDLCINLERLIIRETSADALMPFIRHSVNLKMIDINKFEGNVLNISALNKEREKLQGARKVMISVDEEVYLATKWASMQINFSLIGMQRIDSCKVKKGYGNIRAYEYYMNF